MGPTEQTHELHQFVAAATSGHGTPGDEVTNTDTITQETCARGTVQNQLP